MRLIDAHKITLRFSSGYDYDGIVYIPYREVVDGIRAAPTVDAVPVVRCRDCKHMCRDNVGMFCKVWNGYNGCGYDGFCNYGEHA